MGASSGIAWTDHTFNPWVGCTPVSAGCDHCYMYREQKRYGNDPTKLRRTSVRKWKEVLSPKLMAPGSFVFVCSWSDFFHEDVPFQWRQDAFCRMVDRRDLTFLLLTKRADRIAPWLDEWREVLDGQHPKYPQEKHRLIDTGGFDHIWLGTTAENQRWADERIDILLSIDWPGKRFVSIEPQVGAVQLHDAWLPCPQCKGRGWYLERFSDNHGTACQRCIRAARDIGQTVDAEGYAKSGARLSWIINGGESGPNHRPFNLGWARSLRDQCQAAGVPYFLKQYSGNKPEHVPMLDGKRWAERPEV